jgi:hypothetical protein
MLQTYQERYSLHNYIAWYLEWARDLLERSAQHEAVAGSDGHIKAGRIEIEQQTATVNAWSSRRRFATVEKPSPPCCPKNAVDTVPLPHLNKKRSNSEVAIPSVAFHPFCKSPKVDNENNPSRLPVHSKTYSLIPEYDNCSANTANRCLTLPPRRQHRINLEQVDSCQTSQTPPASARKDYSLIVPHTPIQTHPSHIYGLNTVDDVKSLDWRISSSSGSSVALSRDEFDQDKSNSQPFCSERSLPFAIIPVETFVLPQSLHTTSYVPTNTTTSPLTETTSSNPLESCEAEILQNGYELQHIAQADRQNSYSEKVAHNSLNSIVLVKSSKEFLVGIVNNAAIALRNFISPPPDTPSDGGLDDNNNSSISTTAATSAR